MAKQERRSKQTGKPEDVVQQRDPALSGQIVAIRTDLAAIKEKEARMAEAVARMSKNPMLNGDAVQAQVLIDNVRQVTGE